MERAMIKMITHSTPMGALTSLYAGTMPEAEKNPGAFFIPCARIGTPSTLAEDMELQGEFKSYLEKEIQAFESS
ncbi:hypothetical protein M422DRAFT_271287 [Sphaerobolus stellatus SS14]|uniref:Uncharacterized protein n=1 Tax=Sphaerobolus stellatus (strain SS14) TaxID=990650 RepID=A0A0C9U0N0_SPHS4|nr:hypothetical protein M422DRAFT_271287 [Sphaerobolus stellatus SS14]